MHACVCVCVCVCVCSGFGWSLSCRRARVIEIQVVNRRSHKIVMFATTSKSGSEARQIAGWPTSADSSRKVRIFQLSSTKCLSRYTSVIGFRVPLHVNHARPVERFPGRPSRPPSNTYTLCPQSKACNSLSLVNLFSSKSIVSTHATIVGANAHSNRALSHARSRPSCTPA